MQIESTHTEKTEISIVSTVYNDGEVVPLLVETLRSTIEKLNVSYEIILVNDNSYDDSEEQIKNICTKYPEVKGLSLARNYGQQIAVSAGMRSAKGKYIVIIDGDLENPVSAITELYHKIQEGYDIVYTVSKVRQTFYKRISSELFWFIISKLLRVSIVKNQLLLRIMSRRMADHFNSYNELNRSVAGINHDIGLRSSKIEVVPNKRISGRSNYNFSKRLNIFIDIVLNMSLKPLNFVIFLGFFTFLFSVIVAFYYLYMYLKQGSIPGYTSTILSILFFGSVIVFTLGIMSRYLSLIYLEVRNRPLFLVKEKFNL